MAVVTTEEAIAFVEHAMRNWDDLRFDTDDLEDLRLALGQFLASHTKPAQVGDADREAAWKKLREYCTNGLPFYDNEDGWRAIANAVLRAAEPAQVGDTDREAAKEWWNDTEAPASLAQAFANHRAQGRAEAEREIVALRETVLDEDWLEEAISDSLDLDWQPRIAARLILSRLKESAIDAQG